MSLQIQPFHSTKQTYFLSPVAIGQNSICSRLKQAVQRAFGAIRDAFMRICCYVKKAPTIVRTQVQNLQSGHSIEKVQPQVPNPRLDALYEIAEREEQQSEIQLVRLVGFRSEIATLEQETREIFESIQPELQDLPDDRLSMIDTVVERLNNIERRMNVVAMIEQAMQADGEINDSEERAREALAAFEQNLGARGLDAMRQRARGVRLNAIEANYNVIQLSKTIQQINFFKATLLLDATKDTEFHQRAQEAYNRANESFVAIGRIVPNAKQARNSGNLEELRTLEEETIRLSREIYDSIQIVNNLGHEAMPPIEEDN